MGSRMGSRLNQLLPWLRSVRAALSLAVFIAFLLSFRSFDRIKTAIHTDWHNHILLPRQAQDAMSTRSSMQHTDRVNLHEDGLDERSPKSKISIIGEADLKTRAKAGGADARVTARSGGLKDSWIAKESPRGNFDVKTNARLLQGLRHSSKEVLSFMLVTGERPYGCRTAAGSHLLMKSYKNKVDYCNLHGCKVWYILETWDEGFKGTWARYPSLLRLMQSNPVIEWFMWMDADAIFTDLNFSIPFQTYNGWGKNLVVPGYGNKVYGETGDWISLNAGIFLIRNCQWSYKFLRMWRMMGLRENEERVRKLLNEELKNRPEGWSADDQSALVYLLRKTREKTRERVHVEAEYVLHGYWDFIIDLFEELMAKDQSQWPFVTHFCGCNFCGGHPPSQRCLSGFERAFNFADNQLLALVGLQHHHLNTSSLIQPLPLENENENSSSKSL